MKTVRKLSRKLEGSLYNMEGGNDNCSESNGRTEIKEEFFLQIGTSIRRMTSQKRMREWRMLFPFLREKSVTGG